MTRGLTLGEANWVAQRFHETYEALAPNHGYETRKESRRRWVDVPDKNKALMVDVMLHLFAFENEKLIMTDQPIPNLPLVGEALTEKRETHV